MSSIKSAGTTPVQTQFQQPPVAKTQNTHPTEATDQVNSNQTTASEHQFQSFSPNQGPNHQVSTQSFTTQGDPSLAASLRSQLSAAHAAGAGALQSKPSSPLGENFGATALTSSERSGGTGAQGLNDPNVAVARAHAREVEGQSVDWSNPNATLNNLSQIDSNQGANEGGSDAVRCGAATLIAGSILQGPEQFQQGLGRVHERGERLLQQLDNPTHIQDANGQLVELNSAGQATVENDILSKLRNHLGTIERIQGRDPSELNQGDLSQLQDALYGVAVIDQRTTSDGHYSVFLQNLNATGENERNDYLTTGAIQTYRNELWGTQAPEMNGRPLDVNWVDNGEGGGHYVLADQQASANGHNIAFNPWPESDGTAYSRGTDGIGVSVRPEGSAEREFTLEGINIDNDTSARRLPNR